MYIRKYHPSDCEEMAELFYQTVHTVNAKDYTKEQLEVWATGTVDLEAWNRSFLEHDTVVAVQDDQIVGFGDMDRSGYLDRLYVHKDYQRQGIATAICDRLEREVTAERITTHASITAKPFFQKRGYAVVKEQQVVRGGIALTNYVMEYRIDMDFVLELLLEIILEGCLEITEEKKVPFILRILCAILLVVFYVGLIGIFLFVAISNQNGLMFFITGIVALIILFAFIHKYKRMKKNGEE